MQGAVKRLRYYREWVNKTFRYHILDSEGHERGEVARDQQLPVLKVRRTPFEFMRSDTKGEGPLP